MADDKKNETKKQRSNAWAVIALLLVAAAGGGYWYGYTHPTSTAVPEVKSGRVTLVGGDSSEFAYAPDSGKDPDGISYGVDPHVTWSDAAGGGRRGDVPPCLKPSTHGQHISFGVVHVKSGGGEYLVVVWVKCA